MPAIRRLVEGAAFHALSLDNSIARTLISAVLAKRLEAGEFEERFNAPAATVAPREWYPAAMKRRSIALMVMMAAIWVTTSSTSATGTPSLRSYADKAGVKIGAAARTTLLTTEPTYAQTLSTEFNLLTPENEMKWDSVHPSPTVYDFTAADAMVDFAEQHDMSVFGTTLVWDSQLPSWLTTGGFTRDELMAILRDHIMTVVGRYQGRVYAWNVVNEAMANNGSLRNTFWSQGIGPDYIEMAFQWAHEADPGALLFYNDYGGEALNAKSNGIYELMQSLVQNGVPVNGVGLQMHVGLGFSPPVNQVAQNMARLTALGLDVQITEMDVQIYFGSGTTAQRLAAQAQVYGEMMGACLETPLCTAFVTWGFTDRYSWIPAFTGHPDAPLLFDESYLPKPAYYAVRDALAGAIPVGGNTELAALHESVEGRFPYALITLMTLLTCAGALAAAAVTAVRGAHSCT